MPTRLLLLLCLIVHVFAKKPPDVDCLVVNLQYVRCTWDKYGIPDVNYTFYGWFVNDDTNPNRLQPFHFEDVTECTTYLSENGTNIGCDQPYGKRTNRFNTFYTRLVHGSNRPQDMEHDLKQKVKLNPPTNVTVKIGSDSNLWFYWNQTSPQCVESDIRYRTNNKKWDTSKITEVQSFCINLPSSNSLYELQVRSRLGKKCAESLFWSDWSEPVVWGSNNSTDSNQINGLMAVWTPVLYVFSTLFLIILVLILMHHERLRIILIPVVPKPSLISHDIQDWFQISKGLKESFNPNYNERACTVCEYSHVSESDSESSDSSTSSVTTDQTNCSVSINADSSTLSAPCSSSISTGLVSSEEQVSFIKEASQSGLGSP